MGLEFMVACFYMTIATCIFLGRALFLCQSVPSVDSRQPFLQFYSFSSHHGSRFEGCLHQNQRSIKFIFYVVFSCPHRRRVPSSVPIVATMTVKKRSSCILKEKRDASLSSTTHKSFFVFFYQTRHPIHTRIHTLREERSLGFILNLDVFVGDAPVLTQHRHELLQPGSVTPSRTSYWFVHGQTAHNGSHRFGDLTRATQHK